MRWQVILLGVASTTPLAFAATPTTQPRAATSQPALTDARVASADHSSAPHSSSLHSKLPDIKLDQVRLEDAIDFIRRVSGANIHVNWRALEGAGVSRKTLISMQLSDVPMRTVLRTMLRQASGENQLTFYVDENVIEITTREIADSELITRVYPVEDLVAEVPNFIGPSFDLQNQTNQTSGGGGGGGGGSSGQSLFGSGGTGANGDVIGQQTTKLQRGQSLAQTIEQTIQPSVWRDNGGVASIRYFNGHLIVRAPRSVQEAIAGRF
jgi:hypothetical protein